MLAYVFWHWRKVAVAAADYEAGMRAFHAALAAEPPQGFHASFCVALSHTPPWAAAGNDAYEDWYFIDDFAALGSLNQAAVSGGRARLHDTVANAAAGGTAGVYGRRLGTSLLPPRSAFWLSKPAGMRYDELFSILGPVVKEVGGALWMRQMALGPAREFSLHMVSSAEVSHIFDPLGVPTRRVWPETGRP